LAIVGDVGRASGFALVSSGAAGSPAWAHYRIGSANNP